MADKVGRSQKQLRSMEDSLEITLAAPTSYLRTFEMPLGATEGATFEISALMTARNGRLLRTFIADEQPRTVSPVPANPQFPEVCIDGAIARRPTLCSIGPQMRPREGGASFFAKLQQEAAAIESPYAPKSAQRRRAPRKAEFRRALESDAVR